MYEKSDDEDQDYDENQEEEEEDLSDDEEEDDDVEVPTEEAKDHLIYYEHDQKVLYNAAKVLRDGKQLPAANGPEVADLSSKIQNLMQTEAQSDNMVL